MDREEIAYLGLECRWDPLPQDLDGVGERRSHAVVQGIDLLGRQGRPLPEGEQPSGVEHFVAVGIADAGYERLVAQQVLELAGMAADPLTPHVECQLRV